MNLRQPCESQGGVSPMLRVQAAMPIPTVSVDENRTLARFIRRNASVTLTREYVRGDATHRSQQHGHQLQSAKPQQGGRGATPKRVRDRTPPPAMTGAPKQQMCYEWVAKGEPAVCPSRRGAGNGTTHGKQRAKLTRRWCERTPADLEIIVITSVDSHPKVEIKHFVKAPIKVIGSTTIWISKPFYCTQRR